MGPLPPQTPGNQVSIRIGTTVPAGQDDVEDDDEVPEDDVKDDEVEDDDEVDDDAEEDDDEGEDKYIIILRMMILRRKFDFKPGVIFCGSLHI
jgi:hypothetical protein